MRYIFLTLVVMLVGAPQAQAEAYEIGIQDRLSLRAVIWNEDQRAYENWAILAGEYLVQPDGSISVPLAGSVQARGLTASELSEALASAIAKNGGMNDAPRIAVEVVGYQPFYVLGDVNRPGAYPGVPGLTPLKAVALAGGLRTVGGLQGGAEADSIRIVGNLRGFLTDILRARARRARLEAILAGADGVAFPKDLSHPDGAAALAGVLNEERAIFASDKAAFERELASLEELKALLKSRVAGLESKRAGLAEQLRFSRQIAENLAGLNERGYAPATRLADSQRSLFELESRDTDMQNGIFAARQSIAENEREIIELSARKHTNATLDLQEVQAKLEHLRLSRMVLEDVLRSQGVGVASLPRTEVITRFKVARVSVADQEVVQDIGPTERMVSGDVLTVTTELVSDETEEVMQ